MKGKSVGTPLKNISQNGNLPQVGVKIKDVWNHHPDYTGCLIEIFTSWFITPDKLGRIVIPYQISLSLVHAAAVIAQFVVSNVIQIQLLVTNLYILKFWGGGVVIINHFSTLIQATFLTYHHSPFGWCHLLGRFMALSRIGT